MSRDVRVTFTAAQARVLHDTLSMVLNDPDWSDMLGGEQAFQTLDRAADRLASAREAATP